MGISPAARAVGWTLIPELSAQVTPPSPGIHAGVRHPVNEPARSVKRPRDESVGAVKRPPNDSGTSTTAPTDKPFASSRLCESSSSRTIRPAGEGVGVADTRTAVLFQGKREVLRADLHDRQQLCDLLNQFYAYTEPDIADFEQAVDEFKQRVPELAHDLEWQHAGGPLRTA